MKPELQEKMFTYFTDAVQNISEWSSREIPSFINEYLTWKFAEALIYIGTYALFIGGIALILCLVRKKVVRFLKKSYEEYNGFHFTSLAFGWIFIFFYMLSIIIAFPYGSIKDCIQIKVAPKVYLLERASELVKSK